jgi:hypothetical protein
LAVRRSAGRSARIHEDGRDAARLLQAPDSKAVTVGMVDHEAAVKQREFVVGIESELNVATI